MAYCTQCGSPLFEGARFCTECGAKVADVKGGGQAGSKGNAPKGSTVGMSGAASGHIKEIMAAATAGDMTLCSWKEEIKEDVKAKVVQVKNAKGKKNGKNKEDGKGSGCLKGILGLILPIILVIAAAWIFGLLK